MNRPWTEIYRQNKDGFLNCCDYLMECEGLGAEAKLTIQREIIKLFQPSFPKVAS